MSIHCASIEAKGSGRFRFFLFEFRRRLVTQRQKKSLRVSASLNLGWWIFLGFRIQLPFWFHLFSFLFFFFFFFARFSSVCVTEWLLLLPGFFFYSLNKKSENKDEKETTTQRSSQLILHLARVRLRTHDPVRVGFVAIDGDTMGDGESRCNQICPVRTHSLTRRLFVFVCFFFQEGENRHTIVRHTLNLFEVKEELSIVGKELLFLYSTKRKEKRIKMVTSIVCCRP